MNKPFRLWVGDEGAAERGCKGGGICGDEDRVRAVGEDDEELDGKMVDEFYLECKPNKLS